MLCYAKSLQSCPTLCDPRDGNIPGSPVPRILQARTLEWVAISFSNAWKWKEKVKSLSRVWLLVTHGLQPTRLLHPWNFPGKCTGVGCHCLLRTGYTPMQNKKLKKINEKEKRKGWIFICDLVKFWEYSVCIKKKKHLCSIWGVKRCVWLYYIYHLKWFLMVIDASARDTSFSPPTVQIIARSHCHFKNLWQEEERLVSTFPQMYSHREDAGRLSKSDKKTKQ